LLGVQIVAKLAKKSKQQLFVKGKLVKKCDIEPDSGSIIRDFYEQYSEATRLMFAPDGIIERLRTESIIERFGPKPPAVVYDVGGGAGVYAFPLAKRGYSVHLIDYTPKHIKQAEEEMKRSGISLAECVVGDARSLQVPDSVADMVLLLGPLYHLQKKEDRHHALQEAYRILKPGGIVIAAAISRYASFMWLGSANFLHDPYVATVVEDAIKTGNHNNPEKDPRIFTTAYYHLPEELESEVATAQFKEVKLFALEGPSFLFSSLAETVEDKGALKKLLYFLQMIESDKAIMGATSHMVAAGKK
jgi:ubiquinone/menaquinone biosynthesis C-methylase UbiE